MSYRTSRSFERRDILEIQRETWVRALTMLAAHAMNVSVADFKKKMAWWEKTGAKQYLDSFH